MSAVIHMTETESMGGGASFRAHCRCGWTGPWLPTRNAARKSGDEHLATANATEETP